MYESIFSIGFLDLVFQGKMLAVFKKLPRVGVLDIQGSVKEHLTAFARIGISAIPVKTKEDLDRVSGLIIPGGESTTIGKLLEYSGLDKEIRRRAKGKTLTLWGTCAGAILMAKKVYNRTPKGLKLMKITIERNAYGRQIDSFETDLAMPEIGNKPLRAFFIRAPRVKKVSRRGRILAKYNGEPVAVRQENLLATMFHPELTDDPRVHQYFIEMTKEYANGSFKN